MADIEKRKNNNGITVFTGTFPAFGPSLNLAEKRAIDLNYRHPKCNDLLRDQEGSQEIVTIMNLFLERAKFVAGWKQQSELSQQDKNILISEMSKILKKPEFQSITSGHLNEILELGLQGEFDSEGNKSYSLNARTLRSWIISYKENVLEGAKIKQNQFLADEEMRREHLRKDEVFQKARAENFKQFAERFKLLTGQESDKELIDRFNILMWHREFKNAGEYDYFTKEEKKELYQHAAKMLHVESAKDTLRMAKAEQYCRERLFISHVRKLLSEKVNIEEYLKKINNKETVPF